MSDARCRTDEPTGLRDEVAAAAKAAGSARKTLAAFARLDFSPAAFNKIVSLAGETARLCRRESILASRLCRLQEQRILELEKRNEELALDRKRLTLQLRDALKIKPSPVDIPVKEDAENEEKADEAAASPKRTEKKRGAPRGHRGATRRTPEKAGQDHIVPPPKSCECGCGQIILEDDFDDKFIKDIIPVIREVTRLRYQRGRCAGCGKLVRHKEAHAGPKTSIGPVLSAHLTYLRQAGLTYGQLSNLCHNVLKIPLERSGALGIVNRTTDMMEWVYDMIGEKIKLENIVYADETGWKVRGVPWYVWVFCNPDLVYYHAEQSRAGAVITNVLGEDFKGIVVCDFYAAYNVIEKTQRCLVHLLRDIKKEREALKASKSLERLDRRIRDFINKGLEIRKLPEGPEKEREIGRLRKTLDATTRMQISKGRGPTLLKRIRKYRDQILRFVENPEVDCHNNRSERQLRPLVISRKMSFGSDTPEGAKRNCVLHSVIETCKLQNVRPIDFIEQIIKHAGVNAFNVLRTKLLPIWRC